MIQTETIDNKIRHYSDLNLKIKQVETNKIYDDALDIIPCIYTYEETDIPIEDIELDDSSALQILLRGD